MLGRWGINGCEYSGKKAVVVVRDCVGIAKLKFTELSDVQRSANVARRVAGHGIDQ